MARPSSAKPENLFQLGRINFSAPLNLLCAELGSGTAAARFQWRNLGRAVGNQNGQKCRILSSLEIFGAHTVLKDFFFFKGGERSSGAGKSRAPELIRFEGNFGKALSPLSKSLAALAQPLSVGSPERAP